tara:strand:- start:71 stop:457 length:387 start_codon:yes stop_codon:yes gene_type:complete
MKEQEKQRLIGLAIIAVVLLVGAYFIYKIFFTYGSYAECLGDRTLKPGMSNQQVAAQKKYCQNYFANPKENKKNEKKYKEWLQQNKKRIENMAIEECINRFGDWAILGKSFKIDQYYIRCEDYKYLDG